MAYNLIDEAWIPVERRSGRVEFIAPAQIVEHDDPPIRIASPRPDFDGALLEFLVGLLQTAAAPETEGKWESQWNDPPSVKTLKQRFDTVKEAFFLDGDGPRFMQDLTVARDPNVSVEPVGALLIDRMGESGLSESPTLFAKPGLVEGLSYPAAAAALMTLQTYAPAGGSGTFTSLRGGGPLTTLVLGDTLWATAWLNVLPREEFEERVAGNPSLESPGSVFPWMAKTRSGTTTPQNLHPLQHLWGLPRRVRLDFGTGLTGNCSTSGLLALPIVREYANRPRGTDYKGDYRHPYTPYSLVDAGKPWNPKKGSSVGLPYRDWPLLVTGTSERVPAVVVQYFASSQRPSMVSGTPRLAAFGYAMSNMKPLRWCRAETPLITVDEEHAEAFAAEVGVLVEASESVRSTLCGQVRAAWSDRPKDLDANAVSERVSSGFWSGTEPAFFETVHELKRSLKAGRPAEEAKERWLAILQRAALNLFDTFAEAPPDLAAPDLRRTVLARRSLLQFTSPKATKLRRMLGLTVANDAAPATGKGRRARKPRKETSP